MYRIFISFKKTNPLDGSLTKEYEMAKNLFAYLTNNGYQDQVFLSEEELEKQGDSNFNKNIEKALDEAEVMIVVSDNPAFANEDWVRDEWDGFLNEIKSKRKRGTLYNLTTKSVMIGDLPYGLRKYTRLFYQENYDLLLSYIKHFLESKDSAIVLDWNQQKKDKYYEYTEFGYIRESFSKFVGAEYLIGEYPINKVVYEDKKSFLMSLLNKALELDREEKNVFYLDSVNEINELEKTTDLSSLENLNLFIASIDSINELNEVNNFVRRCPHAKVLFGVYYRNNEVNKSGLIVNVPTFNFGKLSFDETGVFARYYANRTGISIPKKFLHYVLEDALADLRTPLMLKKIFSGAKETENYMDSDFNVTDIFDAIDSGLSDEITSAIMDILALMKRNRATKVLKTLLSVNVAKLEDSGLFIIDGPFVRFSSHILFNYKLAQLIHAEHGYNFSVDEFNFFQEALPYYIYLYYLDYKDLVATDSLSDEGKVALIDLMLSEDEAIKKLIQDNAFKPWIVKCIHKYIQSGLKQSANRLIKTIEGLHIPSTVEFDYLSEKYLLHYEITGKSLDIDYRVGNIDYYRAHVAFCMDDYETSYELYKDAYQKMLETGIPNYALATEYCELLADMGNTDELEMVTSFLDGYIDFLSNSEKEEYYHVKSVIDSDNLRFAEAIDDLNKGIKLCLQDGSMSSLQKFYGDLGVYYMYQGDYDNAKKNLEKNLNLAIMEKNLHGLAISSKMLGKVYFLQKEYQTAYKYFSFAETYAQEADNKWRLAKIRMYLTLLSANKDYVEPYEELASSINSPVFLYDYYLLDGMIKYVSGDNSAMNSFRKSLEQANLTSSPRIRERANFYFASAPGEPTITRKYLQDFTNAVVGLNEETKVKPLPLDSFLYSTLKTERLLLRPLNYDDAPAIFEYTSNPNNTMHVFWRRHRTLADTYDYLASTLSVERTGYYYVWGIELAGKLIGTIDLEYNEDYQAVELGYILNMNYWHHGYAREAAKAVIEFVRSLGIKKIVGACFTANAASQGLLKSVGFSYKRTIENYHHNAAISDKSGLYFELDL